MSKHDDIVKELGDFNHHEAADYVEFLKQQLDGLRADFKLGQADAWDEARSSTKADIVGYDWGVLDRANPYREGESE